VLTEVQRLVRANQRLWRVNQKTRIEDAVIKMAEANDHLVEVRKLITEERATIAMLQDKLAATQEARQKTEDDKAAHWANLEQKLSDVADQVDAELTNQRDAQEDVRGQIGRLESEWSAITNKNDRETQNFQRECKALRATEKETDEITAKKGKGAIDWNNDLISAKMKYKDGLQMLQHAYHALQEQKKQAALAEAAAKAAEEAAAAAPPPKAKAAKKKAKKKGPAAADEAAQTGEGEEGKPPDDANAAEPAAAPEPLIVVEPPKPPEPVDGDEPDTPAEEEKQPREPATPRTEGSRTGSQNRNSVGGAKPGTPAADAPAPASQTIIGKNIPKIVKPVGGKSPRRTKKA
jgi:hypothetical protein